MARPPSPQREAELEVFAEKVAAKVLASIGIHNDEGAQEFVKDVTELRGILASFNTAKKSFFGGFWKTLGTGFFVFVMAAVAALAAKSGIISK